MSSQFTFRLSHDALPFKHCDDLLFLIVDPDLESEYAPVFGNTVVTMNRKNISRCRSVLKIQFGLEEALARLNLTVQDLAWSVVAKDQQIRMLSVMEQGSFVNTDGTLQLLLDSYGSKGLQGNKGIRLDVLITLSRELPRSKGIPFSKGSVIARSAVEFRPLPDYAPFPIIYVDENWFASQSLPKETLWWLQLKPNATPQTDPAAAISIALSETLRSTISNLDKSSSATRLFGSHLANAILFDLVDAVFRLQGDKSMPDDPAGLLGMIADTFNLDGESRAYTLYRVHQWWKSFPARLRAEIQSLSQSRSSAHSSSIKELAA